MRDPFAPLSAEDDYTPSADSGSVITPASTAMDAVIHDLAPSSRATTVAGIDEYVLCTCGCGCQQPTGLTLRKAAENKIFRLAAMYERCDACREPGHYMPPIDKEYEARLAREAAEQQKIAMHELAVQQWRERVPEKFRNAPLDTKDEFLVDRCERFRSGDPKGFLISGSYGTGKTWLAFGFLNHLVNEGIVHPSEILFGSEMELLGIISMGSFAEQEEARRKLFDKRYKIVYIDDVGQGKFRSIKDANSIWYELSDAIWRTDRVIIVSTNYMIAVPKDQRDANGNEVVSPFEQWVGSPAYERLGGMSNYGQITMGVSGDDANYRRINALANERAWQERCKNLSETKSQNLNDLF